MSGIRQTLGQRQWGGGRAMGSCEVIGTRGGLSGLLRGDGTQWYFSFHLPFNYSDPTQAIA